MCRNRHSLRVDAGCVIDRGASDAWWKLPDLWTPRTRPQVFAKPQTVSHSSHHASSECSLPKERSQELLRLRAQSPTDSAEEAKWGSAIVALRSDLVLRERPRVPLAGCKMNPPTGDALPDSHPGACAVADVLDVRGRSQFTAISLYGQWEVMADGRTMYSCARLHRMISDLTGVLAASRRHPVVLAGDLNLTTQVAYSGQTQAETDGAAAAFARLRAWGLTDCVSHTRASRSRLADCTCPEGDACSHVQTFRLNNRVDSRPTQLDYAFVSDSIASKLTECRVVHDDAAWQLSDHCPIVLELDGDSRGGTQRAQRAR